MRSYGIRTSKVKTRCSSPFGVFAERIMIMSKSKTVDYYGRIGELMDFGVKASSILYDTIRTYNELLLNKRLMELHYLEQDADRARQEIIDLLYVDFLPPMNREDIATLTQRIDGIVDGIEEILIKINMYHIKVLRTDTLELAKIIYNSCSSLKLVLMDLSNIKKSSRIKMKFSEVNTMLEKGFITYHNCIYKLYGKVKDPIEFMVWSDIYKSFEHCYFTCKELMNTLELILLIYS